MAQALSVINIAENRIASREKPSHAVLIWWRRIYLGKVNSMISDAIPQKDVKIVEVLSASDLNPKYLQCVMVYISSWLSIPVQNQVRFLPKVLIVASSIPDSLREYSDYLLLINPLEMPTAFVAQAARIIEPRNSIADFVMTSDIDMLPLNVDFETSIINSKSLNQDSFFILRDVLKPGQFPICYNLARPKAWRSLIKRYGSESETSKILSDILKENGGNSAYSGLHGGKGWSIDQETLWNLVQDNTDKIQFKSFTDHQTAHRRLDRSSHRGFIKWLVLPLVFFGYFHDYHVHHPVDSNRLYIRTLIKIRNLGFGLKRS